VVFTAKDDNTVGQSISGSSGNPTGYYASPALGMAFASSLMLSNFRISYAQQAIYALDTSPVSFYNGQVINCQVGLGLNYSTAYLRNVLFANIATNFNCLTQATLDVQNGTFNNINYFVADTLTNAISPFAVTNSVLANVTNLFANAYTNAISAGNNGFYMNPAFGTGQITNSGYPFQTVGAGSYYLTNGCNFSNAGTTNVDSVLLTYLQLKTTHPPIWLTNVTLSANTNLNPQAQRDNSSSPDLGYHYDPLDYLVSNVTVSATLTLTNGVALGLMGSTASLTLQTNSSLISQGTALALNHLAYYANVQEQPVNLGSGTLAKSGSNTNIYGAFRFTDFSMPPGSTLNLFLTSFAKAAQFSFRDCSLHCCAFVWINSSGPGTLTCTNNLLDRCTWYSSGTSGLFASFYNNLFRGGTFPLNSTNATVPWYVQDNLFDQANLSGSALGTSYIICSYNGFTLGTTNYLGGTNNKTNLVADYQAGPLGNYYYPTSGTNLATLINAGSTNASALGLYHYTVSTNLVGGYEVPEGTNIVSIGYHYVAVDQYGNPLDSNGDGIPDYLEDANGNGIYDTGDLGDWQNLNLNVIITRPRNGSILP
jgi:hypothetical protein